MYALGAEGQSSTFNVTNNTFIGNKADLSGGAIIVENLDYYNFTLKNATFLDNLSGLYGDNIYVE